MASAPTLTLQPHDARQCIQELFHHAHKFLDRVEQTGWAMQDIVLKLRLRLSIATPWLENQLTTMRQQSQLMFADMSACRILLINYRNRMATTPLHTTTSNEMSNVLANFKDVFASCNITLQETLRGMTFLRHLVLEQHFTSSQRAQIKQTMLQMYSNVLHIIMITRAELASFPLYVT